MPHLLRLELLQLIQAQLRHPLQQPSQCRWIMIQSTESLAAKHWLRVQPVFRALVQEAIRRRLTFPKDVYRYLHDYVVDRGSTEISQAVPWQDPELATSQQGLSDFLNEDVEVIDPIRDFGKEFRDIQLD